MNWFTIAGTLLHVLKNVPDMVQDVEDFIAKLRGKEEPPDEVDQALHLAVQNAKQP